MSPEAPTLSADDLRRRLAATYQVVGCIMEMGVELSPEQCGRLRLAVALLNHAICVAESGTA